MCFGLGKYIIIIIKDETSDKIKKSEEALALHDLEYQNMIKKHPQLLNPSFSKAKPVHNVYHRIDTADHSPCKAKRRPILANSAKAEMGKKPGTR